MCCQPYRASIQQQASINTHPEVCFQPPCVLFMCCADTGNACLASQLHSCSLEGWGHTGMRSLIAIFSIAPVLLSHASSSTNGTGTPAHTQALPCLPLVSSSEPLTWTNLIWTGLFTLVEESWQGN